jgi:alcohol dehydrogenase class IV
MVLPFTMAFNLRAVAGRLSFAAERVFGKEGALPSDLILWVHHLNRQLGMPMSLGELGLKAADLPGMIDECLTRYPRPTNPVPITGENLKLFYDRLFVGDIAGCIEAFGDRNT